MVTISGDCILFGVSNKRKAIDKWHQLKELVTNNSQWSQGECMKSNLVLLMIRCGHYVECCIAGFIILTHVDYDEWDFNDTLRIMSTSAF